MLERNGKYVRLRIEHGLRQKEYLFWKYKALKPFVTRAPRHVSSYQRIMKRTYRRLHFSTYSLEQFEPYWNAFYPNGKKCITELVCKWLRDPISLAVWFMDDGYKRNDCNAFRMSTDAFSKAEQVRLQKTLTQHFRITSALHRKGKWWNLYIPENATKRFHQIVSPYILPSLRYKVALAP